MKTFKCLEEIQKEDVIGMEFDNLRVLVTEVNREVEIEKMRQFLLNIIDVRDVETDCRIIDFTKGAR